MDKACAECGKVFRRKPSHWAKAVYCSYPCMAAAYSRRLSGRANPNFKDAGTHVCLWCGKAFKRYNKASKYCSRVCTGRANAVRNRPRKVDANQGEIVEALLGAGYDVFDASQMGGGVPDLLVSGREPVSYTHLTLPTNREV